MESPRFHRYRFAEIPEKPKPVLPLEEMSWEERFVAAWVALCKMECRAENAERRVKELEGRLPALVSSSGPARRPR